ncbi:hypothetical protein D3C71_1646290 [compost metagenome]
MLRIFQEFIGCPYHHRYAELLRRCHFTRRAVQVRILADRFAVIGRIEHNCLLLTHLINHVGDKAVGIQHRVIEGVNQLLFRTEIVDAGTLRLIARIAAWITL